MEQIKLWAYLSQTGLERTTAWDAARVRRRDNYGRPDGRVFFSTHRSGERYPMTLRLITGKRAHFAYIGDGPPPHAGQGESLQHSLFKQALAGLKTVTLRLKDADHRLSIEQGQNEALINHPSGRFYRSDTHWQFSSSTLLDKRWLGSVHVEVNHTHGIEREKAADFFSLNMAMIEVDIPEIFAFDDGEDATAEQCQRYLKKVNHILSMPNGFLSASIRSDPISDVIRANEQRISDAESGASASASELRVARSEKSSLETRLSQVTGERDRLAASLSDARSKLEHETKGHSDLRQENNKVVGERDELKSDLSTLTSKYKIANFGFWLFLALIVSFFMYVLYTRIFPDHSESTADAPAPGIEATSPAVAQPPSILPGAPRSASLDVKRRSHHKKVKSRPPQNQDSVEDDTLVDGAQNVDGPTTEDQ
jgi:hypothetical protein